MQDVSALLEEALAVRRRLVAELVADEAAQGSSAPGVPSTPKTTSRLQAKIAHLDQMIGRLEATDSQSDWWGLKAATDRPVSELQAG